MSGKQKKRYERMANETAFKAQVVKDGEQIPGRTVGAREGALTALLEEIKATLPKAAAFYIDVTEVNENTMGGVMGNLNKVGQTSKPTFRCVQRTVMDKGKSVRRMYVLRDQASPAKHLPRGPRQKKSQSAQPAQTQQPAKRSKKTS